ncbi:MAG: hypothetical protein ACXVVQ_23030, partial [Solirubrobacteraceae bacterium]
LRLPPTARRSGGEPAGAGAALSTYSVSVPVVQHLVDLHEYFIVPSATVRSVVDWMQRHRPAGSIQGDSGAGGSPGEWWTSFEFRRISGFAIWPELVANAVTLPGGDVAVRVDAQTAPQPRLPGTGRGRGQVRVVELGTMLGAFGYVLRCAPSGGTVLDPARACAAILADPRLLYGVAGPDHSCPAGAPTVTLRGSWNGKPLRSSFSECDGGQEEQAAQWATLLPSADELSTVHVDRGIGLVRLGEREAPVIELPRGQQHAPPPCSACTRTFRAGFSIGYGARGSEPAGWTVKFSRGAVSRIASDFGLTVDGAYAPRGFASLRRALHGFSVRRCGAQRQLLHRSALGTTAIVYRADVSSRCSSAARGSRAASLGEDNGACTIDVSVAVGG